MSITVAGFRPRRRGGSDGPGERGRWSLRRRLVVLVVLLTAGVVALMGVLSTLALRESLVDQLDAQLMGAAERGDRGGPPPAEWEDDGPPRGLDVPGQRVGTLTVFSGPEGTESGYIDDSGDLRTLEPEQEDALVEVPADGDPHTVEVPELGTYRVLATPDDDVDRVTGLPMAEVTDTLTSHVATEVAVAVAGLALAAGVGAFLVRREMRPLERVAATATRVSELPLTTGAVALPARVPSADTDPGTEVGQVGGALNRMLDHVEHALSARHRSETQVRQFVADASHELRTPLAAIRGYAELVRRRPGELPPDVAQAMSRVESESRRMTALVEDLLLLARLDAGRPLERADVDLAALAVGAVADAHAAGPDHVWHLDLPAQEAPAVVLGDEHRLQQVLVNLLGNARVHTPPGTTVTTTVRPAGADVVVAVADDGPGVPEAVRGTLFERFARADAGRSRATGSTGLGLAIVRAVVSAHGGRVEVASSPAGTVFTVTLPAAPATRPEVPAPAPA